jgi:hypothetical protein
VSVSWHLQVHCITKGRRTDLPQPIRTAIDTQQPKRSRLVRDLIALVRSTLLALLMASSAAQAQGLFRAYVASNGNDGNPCTLQAPCRLMPAALAVVANGGEIWMLDSANYNTNPVNVTKSVSILAVPGAVGSLLASMALPAITIEGAGLRVGLRNLVITNLPGNISSESHGVRMVGASSLTIESSLLANLPGHAVQILEGGTLKVVNSTLRDNGGRGVFLFNGARATISSTQMIGNGGGVLASASAASTTTLSIVDSLISGGFRGVSMGGNGGVEGVILRASIARSTIEQTTIGLLVQTPDCGSCVSEANVGNTVIVDNEQAWAINGTASILSLGNNQVSGNLNPPSGALSPLAPL